MSREIVLIFPDISIYNNNIFENSPYQNGFESGCHLQIYNRGLQGKNFAGLFLLGLKG
jgi:hypothetical protein